MSKENLVKLMEAVRTIGDVTGAITEELSDGELDLVSGRFKNPGGLDHCLKPGPPKSLKDRK